MSRKALIWLLPVLLIGLTLAQIEPPEPPGEILGCSPGVPLRDCILSIFMTVLRVLLVVALVLAAVFIVWGGFEYILGGGDEKKRDAIRNRIVYAVLGLVIAFLAWAMVLILERFLTGGQPI